MTRRVRTANPDVTLVDIPADNPTLALRAIELLHQEMPDAAIFAIGNLNQPQVIVNAMRAGAREFIERPTTPPICSRPSSASRARNAGGVRRVSAAKFSRSSMRRVGTERPRSPSISHSLCKSAYGQTALVDLAPLGHAALHMNLKPVFNVADANRNLHRMDASLLESFMTRHSGGLQLLAGTNMPAAVDPSTAEFVRLFDMLVTHLPLCGGRCVIAF